MRRFFRVALLVAFIVSANNLPQLLQAGPPTLRPAPRPPALKQPAPQISRFVTIRARHTGLVLDVANFGKQDAPTNTAAYVGQANQQWLITELPDGFCTIKARHNGLVLDVRNYGKQSAKVSTCGYVGQTNQQWKITKLPNGFSTIAARHSGLVLDVDDWGGQGAWVSTCGYVKQSNQEWLIEEVVDNSQWVKFPLKGAVDSPLFAAATILCRSHPDGPIVTKISTKDVEAILRKAAKDAGIPLCSPVTSGGGRINFQVQPDKDIKLDLAAEFHCKLGKPVQMELFLIRSHISDFGKNIVAGLINADQKVREGLLPIVNRKLNETVTAPLGNDLLCVTVQADGLIVIMSDRGPLSKKVREYLTSEFKKLLNKVNPLPGGRSGGG